MSEFDSLAVLAGRMYSHTVAVPNCLIHCFFANGYITGSVTEGYLYIVNGNITELSVVDPGFL